LPRSPILLAWIRSYSLCFGIIRLDENGWQVWTDAFRVQGVFFRQTKSPAPKAPPLQFDYPGEVLRKKTAGLDMAIGLERASSWRPARAGGLLSHVGTLEPSLMSEIRTVTCAKCHRPLMLIDFYGQQLVPRDLRLSQDVLFPPAELGERVVLSGCGAVTGAW
jgi:hypothetical protein